jgi:uncharacterized protein YndB with AHSA1/START domain
MKRSKIELEYIFKASPTIVYSFLTTPACLVRWFCDEVDIIAQEYTFVWQGYDQKAFLRADVEDEYLKFVWEDSEDSDEYLEFKISTSPITNETILHITDFCDEDEVDSQEQLWDSQVKQMRQEMGAG